MNNKINIGRISASRMSLEGTSSINQELKDCLVERFIDLDVKRIFLRSIGMRSIELSNLEYVVESVQIVGDEIIVSMKDGVVLEEKNFVLLDEINAAKVFQEINQVLDDVERNRYQADLDGDVTIAGEPYNEEYVDDDYEMEVMEDVLSVGDEDSFVDEVQERMNGTSEKWEEWDY